jgi:hypothetical protein
MYSGFKPYSPGTTIGETPMPLKPILCTAIIPTTILLSACNSASLAKDVNSAAAAPAQSADNGVSSNTTKTYAEPVASLTQNQLKAFAYEWYSRFDKRVPFTKIQRFLPIENVKFTYPAGIFTTVEGLADYNKQVMAAVPYSRHVLDEIFVNRTSTANVFEIVAPHSYLGQRATGERFKVDFLSRMRVQTGLDTPLDPTGTLPKVVDYVVIANKAPGTATQAEVEKGRTGKFDENDVKAFVHKWFAYVDLADEVALMNLTSNGVLNVDILGNKLTSKEQLKKYLIAQEKNQAWANHRPSHISVSKSGNEYKVSFIVNFEGDVTGMGIFFLNNVTNWTLVEEDGELRMRDYSLVIL